MQEHRSSGFGRMGQLKWSRNALPGRASMTHEREGRFPNFPLWLYATTTFLFMPQTPQIGGSPKVTENPLRIT
jgi:hypothetical protein